ncbi:DoxX family protein [Flavobacterium channae]|uniref:DoxX family protein n=1 Tax=Flavobacterium channae TaxID=2897181 RepID=UPI001E4819B0|nr:DoxX family protein [Flavobacterium channae]UGS22870.1 DoxX family protein [Flavobacterium channae]
MPAIILFQTLFFKFSAAPESVAIFSKLGIEPIGRIGTGIIELVAAILLIIPKKSFYGAFIGFGTMVGAIASHLFILGIETNNDKGFLFILACTTALFCLIVLYQEREKINYLVKKLFRCL